MTNHTSPNLLRFISTFRIAALALLVVSCGFVALRSLHWPMLVDSPIMHYVNFLMDHGMRPYQDITDNNMPGAYLTEGWAMALFGGGDLGWRMYDFFLLAAMMAAMTVIAWPYDRLAGVYAGALFSLMHITEGPWFAAEREQVITALLLGSCAFLFVSARRGWPWLSGVFGFLSVMAASIKPTFAPFALAALLLVAMDLRRRKQRAGRYVVWGFGGMAVAAAINLLFLFRNQAFRPFFFVLNTVTRAYVGLNRPGWRFMVLHVAPTDFMYLVVLALVALLLQRRWNTEWSVLLLGASFGAVSYMLQQKGFYHHRYTLLAFVLLLAGMELLSATRRAGLTRLVGCLGLLVPLLTTVRWDVQRFRALPRSGLLVRSMESDLRSLGVDRLQGEVQCFDLVYGCLNSLYHLGLVENTGFTGDLLLFTKESSPATTYYREKFWESQAKHPATVFVVTNEVFGEPNSFGKIDRWPEFASYLEQNYFLAMRSYFPTEDVWGTPMPMESARAYRIYVRKGSELAGVVMPSGPGEGGPLRRITGARP